jgi:hypothetical protein
MLELDQVVIVEDLRELPIRAGDIGTVVGVYLSNKAYEVEFVSLTGQTVGVATLPADKVRVIHEGEIAHARLLVTSKR